MNRRNYLSTTLQGSAALLAFPYASFGSSKREENLENLIRLNANENPYGPSPLAREAIQEYAMKGNRYGDNLSNELLEKIAQKYQLNKDYVMLGAGSTEILQNIGIWAVHQQLPLYTGKPVFHILGSLISRLGGKVTEIPLSPQKNHDLNLFDQKIDQQQSIIYIVNPNNPSGTTIPKQRLMSFCQQHATKHYIVVDEAYIEYLPNHPQQSMLQLIEKFPKIIVVRTFSKIFGLAGMRIGYAISHPDTIAALQQYQAWTNASMNVCGLAAALTSLNDQEFIHSSIQKNANMLKFTKQLLDKLKITYIPSQVNFMYMNINAYKGNIGEDMFKYNIILRPFQDEAETWCRVTMGHQAQMQIFAQRMQEIWKV